MTETLTKLMNGIQLCVGLDPNRNPTPDFFRRKIKTDGELDFLIEWGRSILEACKGSGTSVKFQSAYYEARGGVGIEALTELMALAREKGFYTILDAKRGDIGSTMVAYGQFAFDLLKADALTITPYMGPDTMTALNPWADQGKTIIAVWLTSNIHNNPFQEMLTKKQGAAKSIAEQLLNSFPNKSGLVVGAQRLDSLEKVLIEKMQDHLLLVPGIGAQGGGLSANWLEGFATWPKPVLIAQSRGVHGDLGKSDGLPSSIDCWVSYQDYVRKNVTRIKKSLGLGG